MSNANKYGTVKTAEGVVVMLQQEAYVSSDNTYEAYGTDDNGGEYKVTWQVKEFDDGIMPDDESDMCDWDKYTVRQL